MIRSIALLRWCAVAAALVCCAGPLAAAAAAGSEGWVTVLADSSTGLGTEPHPIAVGTATGLVYIGDRQDGIIRTVHRNGSVAQLAPGFRGVEGVAVDEAAGLLFVADTDQHCVRTVLLASPATAPVAVAGTCGTRGFADGASPLFYYPTGIALAPGGVLLVADTFNNRVRRLDPLGGGTYAASTLAGSVPADAVQFPTDVVYASAAGLVFFVQDHCLRSVPLAGGAVVTVAGDCAAHGLADAPAGASASSARFNYLEGLWADPLGTVFLADGVNRLLRGYDAGTGRTWTAAGSGARGAAAAGPPRNGTSFARLARVAGFGVPGPNGTNPLYASDPGSGRLLSLTATCSAACQHGGLCDRPEHCSCPAGFSGPACEVAICVPACAGGMVCVDKDVCGCPAGYSTPPACSTPVCDSGGCQNGGNCTSPNVCSCAAGQWSGDRCQTPVCASPCANNGTCVAPSTCNCTAGVWTGAVCDVPVCPLGCLNGGNCTAPGTCTCATGWNGTQCEQAVCSPGCDNGGNCTAPNVCACTTGWTGPTCAAADCSPPCLHGLCTNPGECLCDPGWSGPQCSVPVCAGGCGAGGNCTAPDNCTCTVGWSGVSCDVPLCTGAAACQANETCAAPSTCVTVCDPPCAAPNGICETNATCTCLGGWVGLDCSYLPCFDGCAHGRCLSPMVCTCDAGWNGTNCTLPVCSVPCSANGACTAPDTCTCQPGWAGSVCDQAVCDFGFGTTCINGGNCTAPGVCTCAAGFEGDRCESPICTTRCINGGVCLAPDQCGCAAGFEGDGCARLTSKTTQPFATRVGLLAAIVAGPVLLVSVVAWQWRMAIDRRRLKRFLRVGSYGPNGTHGTTTDGGGVNDTAGGGGGDGRALTLRNLRQQDNPNNVRRRSYWAGANQNPEWDSDDGD